jgi:peptide/nickel transport system ATP-binding protein
MNCLLEISDLQIEFRGGSRTVEVVRGCHLQLPAGQILGLVGESGSGKSMTALACLGLVPKPGRVTGSIRLDGHEMVEATEAAAGSIRGNVAAMIFQNPGKALNPFFTIGQQLVYTIAHVRRLDTNTARRAAISALVEVSVPDPEHVLRKYPHQVSGGQLQRIMIAMALGCKPKLLIADEPTTALDVTIQAQIIVLLRELACTHGLTVLFITHDLGVVSNLCDRLAVMYAGQVVESGPVEELLNDPAHPYTASLLTAVPVLGGGRKLLTQIPGSVPDMGDLPRGCAFHPRCSNVGALCDSESPKRCRIASGRSVACHHPVIPMGISGPTQGAHAP